MYVAVYIFICPLDTKQRFLNPNREALVDAIHLPLYSIEERQNI